jgi:hypothetical protein
LVRGRKPGGKERKTKDIIRTLVHEVSHFLVESYGFSKIIKNETSEKEQVETERLFERYRSEFRAYWVSGLEYEFPAEDKREAIKVRLVGTGAKDQGAYPNLRDAYWIKRSSFRALVDSYGYGGVNKTKPEGFNLTNSPRLDDLFHKLEKAATRTVSTGEVKDAIKKLKLDERTEARKSELIRDKINALANAEEIRAELSR